MSEKVKTHRLLAYPLSPKPNFDLYLLHNSKNSRRLANAYADSTATKAASKRDHFEMHKNFRKNQMNGKHDNIHNTSAF
jgi:hypothetical protein